MSESPIERLDRLQQTYEPERGTYVRVAHSDVQWLLLQAKLHLNSNAFIWSGSDQGCAQATRDRRFCVIATEAHGRHFVPTIDKAVEHAKPMMKNAERLLIVEVVKVVEHSAPPVVARDPREEDFTGRR